MDLRELRAKYAGIVLQSPRLMWIRERIIDVMVLILVPFCVLYLLVVLPYAHFRTRREHRKECDSYSSRDRGWN